MKVLVTGGTGFTGNNLARKLYRSGFDVRLLVRNGSKVNTSSDFDPEIIPGDITDPHAVDRAVRGVDKVFHLAAVYRIAGISNTIYWDVHVEGTKNLLNSSVKHGVIRFVHCSTVGVHGHIQNPPANETYRFGPGDIYQLTKLEGERKAVRCGNETGLPVAIIRPCPIYGPGDMRLFKLFKMASRRIMFILGAGDIMYHMVYIDDLVDAFILASESSPAVGEAFIIGGTEKTSLNRLMELIAIELAVKPLKLRLPAKPFQLLGTACEHVCIPLGLEPPIYRRRVDFFTKSRSFDITKARSVLDYRPKVSLATGLANTAAWYKKQGLL